MATDAVLFALARSFRISFTVTDSSIEAVAGWVVLDVEGESAALTAAGEWLADQAITITGVEQGHRPG